MPRLMFRLLLLMLMFFSASSLAPAFALTENAAELLSQDGYSETLQALPEIAKEPNAEALLKAMSNRQLYLDKAGKSLYVASAPRAKADLLIRVNNRVRGAIEALMGSLTMLSPDRKLRIAAAEALFKSRDVNALEALNAALAAEKDAGVKRAFLEAKAAIELSTGKVSASALDALAVRGDGEALQLLRSVSPSTPEVRRAIAAIEFKQSLLGMAQNFWYGLSLGSVLLLAAIGLAITFGVMGVINMAHGEMVMLGAYVTFAVQEFCRTNAPQWLDFSLFAALPLAFFITMLVGIAIERGIIRFLYGNPLETLLATFGVSLILQQAIRTLFGSSNREVSNPSFMTGSFDLFGLSVNYSRLSILAFTCAVFALLLMLMRYTSLGLQMRAVTQNRRMASSMGINTSKTDALTFGLGSGIAGVAGVALSQIDNVSPNLGQSYIIDSFMVVVFGGVGSLWGTLISAFTLGISNKLLEPFAGAVLAKITILVLLILFIQKKPKGLFALKGRFVE